MSDIKKQRIYLTSPTFSDVKVPFTKLHLSNDDELLLSTVKGERNSDDSLPTIRAPFINKRLHDKNKTQLDYAKENIVTEEMEYVSIRESYTIDKRTFSVDEVLQEIKNGHAVIPCNVNHTECEPMIIGKKFSVKVNANIGASSVSSNEKEEIAKLKLALEHGADTVMDLSTGISNITTLRSHIIKSSPVPIGTVPIYECLDRAQGKITNLNWELFKEVLIDQAKQGVDYFTIHAGLIWDLLAHAAKRQLGIVSRGGAIMANYMVENDSENFAYTHFDEILEICHEYDVAISLGDGLRPGGIIDACDKAQYGELETIGTLAKRAYEASVQCFIEGPGHVPLDKIKENQDLENLYTNNAPFYTLGPLVTDIAPGYDHITAAIGGARIAECGTAMLCYVTPSEHLALPNKDDVKVGLITFKLAAHAADLAKKLPGAQIRDNAMSKARAEFRWFDQFALSLDEEHALNVWKSQMPESCSHEPSFCSMCGPRFCPMRLNKRLQEKFNNR